MQVGGTSPASGVHATSAAHSNNTRQSNGQYCPTCSARSRRLRQSHRADEPDVSALPSATTASSDHTMAYALGGAALAVVTAVGAGDWYVRRKRAV